jgi:hypothetical protein
MLKSLSGRKRENAHDSSVEVLHGRFSFESCMFNKPSSVPLNTNTLLSIDHFLGLQSSELQSGPGGNKRHIVRADTTSQDIGYS